MRSPRRRPAVRKVTFTDHVGDSLAVMKASFERGVELAWTEREKPGDRGAGVPLKEDW